MRTFLKVFAFNVVIIAFFLYVGNSIPQLRQDPPTGTRTGCRCPG